jgi:hypothetical protein
VVETTPYPPAREIVSTSVISLSGFLYLELACACALAAWVILRHPAFGPRSLTAAFGLVVLALALGDVAPFALRVLVSLPCGIYLALLGCVLPVFFAMCLTTGWLMRALLDTAQGSSGGGGLRTDA